MAKKKIEQSATPIAVLITDTHLDLKNVDLVRNIFDQVIDYCKDNSIETVFHGGDFFNSREAQPLDVLSTAQEIIQKISMNLNYYAIPGNHDKVDLDSMKSYLDFMPCNLIKSRDRIAISAGDEVEFHFVPYFKEKGNYLEYLKQAIDYINKNKTNILITHIAVNGVKNNDASIVENDITSDLFKKFDKVFVGHYHNQSKIGDNIYYVGSAYQANFGEDTNKGMTVIYADGSHKFVQLDFPHYITHEINFNDLESIKLIKEQAQEKTSFIRTTIKGDENQIKTFDKKELESLGVKVRFKQNKVEVETENNNELISFDRGNITQAFEEFCTSKSISDKDQGIEYLSKIL